SHHPLHDYQVPAAVREDLRCAITHDHGVFDTHTTVSRQIHPWLHGDNHARAQLPCTTLPQARCLVHPQPHTVSQSVWELVTVPGIVDDLTRRGTHSRDLGAWLYRLVATLLCTAHQLVQLPLPLGRLTEHE